MPRSTPTKRKGPGGSGSSRNSGGSGFNPEVADDTPTKRRRTPRTPKNSKEEKTTVVEDEPDAEIEEESEEIEDDIDEEDASEVETRFQRATFGGAKNSQMKSLGRAEVNYGDIREEMCLRCAGEVAQFPILLCSNAPNSVAGKCMDCVKKAKGCEKVPASLKPSLAELEKAASRFVAKELSQSDLNVAQAAFDQQKRRLTHSTKVLNAEAQKSPWKPSVDATKELHSSVSSAILQLQSDLTKTLKKEFSELRQSNGILAAEIVELRNDFRMVYAEHPAEDEEPAAEVPEEAPVIVVDEAGNGESTS